MLQDPVSAREALVERASSLPLGNAAALLRLARLCESPIATAAGIALEAARDEGFSALLLKLANSAYYASATRIADLATAVARLGLRTVAGLAVASPGLRLLAGANDELAPARRELHRHAVRVGLAARMLAPSGVDPERALAAGLLHNLGLNVIALYEPTVLRAALAEPDAEVSLLGVSHATLGADLAERWQFPPTLVDAIREHDAPEPASELGALVQVADLLVRETGCGIEPPRELAPRVCDRARVRLESARGFLAPLLQAQDRMEQRMAAELEALDSLA
jgi:putative nucleotidyltransferase with HDIG domain